MNRKCLVCDHIGCMACVKETWKVGIPQVGGMAGPYRAEKNLVCCQCHANNLLHNWIEVKEPRPSKGTHPDLFEIKDTRM